MAALSHQREEKIKGGGEKRGGGESGKAQERQEIVHFAKGTFNYLIAELMLCPQVTLDVRLQQEDLDGKRWGGKERG